MSKLKLYHCALSPPSRAALLTVRQLGLDIEVVNIDLLKKEQFQSWYLQINPQHSVPVLDDDGFILWESRAITAYLINKYAPGSDLYPSDPKFRAIVDERLNFDATTLYPRVRQIAFNAIFLEESVITEEKKKTLLEAMGWMNDFLKNHKYFASDNLTIADMSILASISAIIHIGVPLIDYPNVQRWYNDCKLLQGFAEHDEGVTSYANLIREKLTQGF